MKSTAEKIAEILLDIKAISLNPKHPFKYASGILSPIYTDCRILISYPEKRKIIRNYYIEAIKSVNITFDVIAGTATAGIPHAAWIADKMQLPMIYVRGKAKDHGRGNQIEGVIRKNQQVAVIEDLVSTAASSCQSVEAVRTGGGQCSYVFSIMTYDMKAAHENLEKNNINLVSLTNFETVVKIAYAKKYIQKKDQEIILDWIINPLEWSKN